TISERSERILRLKGTTEAVESRAILAPILSSQQVSALTIVHLTPGGTRVKKGDVLVEFDRQLQMKDYVDKNAEYQKLVDQVAQGRANAELMQVHSPLDGVVVLATIWKQGNMGEVQEGDQVRSGVAFMQVVNPSLMQVRVLANQQDFPSLQVGQTAKVRPDAY